MKLPGACGDLPSGESSRLPPMWSGLDSVLDVIRGLSMLILYFALRGFYPGSPVSPSHEKHKI